KVIGKLGHCRLGAIAVRDDGGASSEGIGARASAEPSGRGYFAVGRVAYDLGDNQKLGVLVTDHVTDGYTGAVPAVIGWEQPSATHNTVVSLDTRLRLTKSLFFYGQLGGSRTRADTLTSGPRERSTFSDHLSTLTFEWNDGKRHLLGYQDYIGSRFRADAGFLERIDARNTGYEATVTFRPENRWLRYVEPTSNGDQIDDTRGQLEERRLAGAIRWGFQKQTFVETRVAHVDERWLSTLYDRWRYIASASNSLWRPLSFGLDLTFEDGIFYAPTD